jgi:hypothetical protein
MLSRRAAIEDRRRTRARSVLPEFRPARGGPKRTVFELPGTTPQATDWGLSGRCPGRRQLSDRLGMTRSGNATDVAGFHGLARPGVQSSIHQGLHALPRGSACPATSASWRGRDREHRARIAPQAPEPLPYGHRQRSLLERRLRRRPAPPWRCRSALGGARTASPPPRRVRGAFPERAHGATRAHKTLPDSRRRRRRTALTRPGDLRTTRPGLAAPATSRPSLTVRLFPRHAGDDG